LNCQLWIQQTLLLFVRVLIMSDFLCTTCHFHRSLYVLVRPSVVCLSYVCLPVTFVHPTQAIEIFGNVSNHLIRWPSADMQVKFYGDRPRETPPSGELNTRGVAEYSDFGPIERYISRKRWKIGAKFVLITNRTSHMCFPLVPNSLTLDDFERRNTSSSNRRIISPNSVVFRADYVKVVGWRYASNFCTGNVGRRI